jgi:hypothetical protein
MKAIYKFQLNHGQNCIAMHQHAALVAFGTQQGVPHVWAEVDTNLPYLPKMLNVVPTGQPFESHWYHRFTCFDGPFVWHLLESV